MQHEVKHLFTEPAVSSGLSGPIPNAAELRKKREQARRAALGALGRVVASSPDDEAPARDV